MNHHNGPAREISPILRTVAKFAVPLIFIMSVLIFFQGHNLPGGGFIAGVLVAAAGALYLMAFGVTKAVGVRWWMFSVVGLLISVGTGAATFFLGKTYMDHTVFHWDFNLPIIGHELPTATFFDLGVYLIVFGTLMTIFVELAQEEH